MPVLESQTKKNISKMVTSKFSRDDWDCEL